MEGLDKTRIIVVCGPTASGKTALALQLCRAYNGEMVGADSMQIYSGLPIGTAAPTPQEAAGVPMHLVGFLPPEVPYSVAQYTAAANKAIAGIHRRGRLPVVCGGTGLYVQALVEGTRFVGDGANGELRARLDADLARYGAAHMLEMLREVDADCAETLHERDTKRILRALELWHTTKLTAAQRSALSKPEEPPYNALCIALGFAQRSGLYSRIEQRVDAMLDAGIVSEAERVYQNRGRYATAAQAIGYKEFFPYFEGEATLEECTARLKQATRNYAKRQLTWLRRMPYLHWVEADVCDAAGAARRMVDDFMGAD